MIPVLAQDILARGGGFYTKVMGDDPSYDSVLFYLDRLSQDVAPSGLSAEFHTSRIPGAWLDEDGDGRDEVYATVVLTNLGRSSRALNSGQLASGRTPATGPASVALGGPSGIGYSQPPRPEASLDVKRRVRRVRARRLERGRGRW